MCLWRQTPPLILVVDDDRDTRELYGLVLQVRGYRHAQADGVETAVSVARRVRPDVILTDWMLGDGDGIALCLALHRHGRTRRTPIIAATGMSLSPEIRTRARQLGCEIFLIKPIDVDALVRTVSNTLQVTQARSLRAAAVRLRRYARGVRDSARTAPAGAIASQLLAASRARVSKSVALIVADDSGRYLAVNDRVAELTGYASNELTTMSVADLTPDDVESMRPRLWSRVHRSGHTGRRLLPQAARWSRGSHAVCRRCQHCTRPAPERPRSDRAVASDRQLTSLPAGDCPDFPLSERITREAQLIDNPSADEVFLDDALRVLRRHIPVPRALGVDDADRSVRCRSAGTGTWSGRTARQGR